MPSRSHSPHAATAAESTGSPAQGVGPEWHSDFVAYVVNSAGPNRQSILRRWFRSPRTLANEYMDYAYPTLSYRDPAKRPDELRRDRILQSAHDYYMEKGWRFSIAVTLILTILFYLPALFVYIFSEAVSRPNLPKPELKFAHDLPICLVSCVQTPNGVFNPHPHFNIQRSCWKYPNPCHNIYFTEAESFQQKHPLREDVGTVRCVCHILGTT